MEERTIKLADGGDEKFRPLLETAIGSLHQQVVMPLFTKRGDDYVPIGTGFMVSGDGLMMTASHVVAEAVGIGAPQRDTGDQSVQGEHFYALYITNEKHGPNNEQLVGGLWPIDRAWCNNALDVGWCWLRGAARDGKRITFNRMRLSPGLPQIGDEVTGFGYYGLADPTQETSAESLVINYDLKGSFTTGKVIEVHPVRRDCAMLAFPCFRTDARFDPGMSGGPIVNKKGDVCGVICSSFGRPDGFQHHISYASLIWPVLGTTIDIAPAEGEPTRPTYIRDLIPSGYIAWDGSESTIEVVSRSKIGIQSE